MVNDQKEKAATKRRKIHEFRGHTSSAFVDEQVSCWQLFLFCCCSYFLFNQLNFL